MGFYAMWYSINLGHNMQGTENIRLKRGYKYVSRHKLNFTIDIDLAHWLRGEAHEDGSSCVHIFDALT